MIHQVSFKTAIFYYMLREAEKFLHPNEKNRVHVQRGTMTPVGERGYLEWPSILWPLSALGFQRSP